MPVGDYLSSTIALLRPSKDRPEPLVQALCEHVAIGIPPTRMPKGSVIRQLVNCVVKEFFADNPFILCNLLPRCANHFANPSEDKTFFLCAVIDSIWQHKECFNLEKKMDEICLNFPHLVVCAALISSKLGITDMRGKGNHLLRSIGGLLSAGRFEIELASLDKAEEIGRPFSPWVIDVFAEGQVRKLGARKVLEAYRAKNSPSVSSHALETELRALCSLNTTDETVLAKRKLAFAWLALLIGPAEAGKWLAGEFPHLVGEIS